GWSRRRRAPDQPALDPDERGAAPRCTAAARGVELPEHPGDLHELLGLSATGEHRAPDVHRHNGFSSLAVAPEWVRTQLPPGIHWMCGSTRPTSGPRRGTARR